MLGGCAEIANGIGCGKLVKDTNDRGRFVLMIVGVFFVDLLDCHANPAPPILLCHLFHVVED